MRTKCLATAVGLLLIAPAGPLSAQRWGTVEVGAHVQRSLFADVLQLDDAFGFGGRLGLFVLSNLSS